MSVSWPPMKYKLPATHGVTTSARMATGQLLLMPNANATPYRPGVWSLASTAADASSESLAYLLVGVEHLLDRHVEESCNLKRER
jgi:hypothetical protein